MTAEEQAIRDWIYKAGLEIRKLTLKPTVIVWGEGAGSFTTTLVAKSKSKKKTKAKKGSVIRSIVPPENDPLKPKPLPPMVPIADGKFYYA